MSDIAYVYTSYFLENFFTDSSWIVPQISSKLPPEIRQRILLGFFWDSCISFDTDSIWRFLEFSSTFLNLTSNLFRNIFILLYENLLYRFIREFLFFFWGIYIFLLNYKNFEHFFNFFYRNFIGFSPEILLRFFGVFSGTATNESWLLQKIPLKLIYASNYLKDTSMIWSSVIPLTNMWNVMQFCLSEHKTAVFHWYLGVGTHLHYIAHFINRSLCQQIGKEFGIILGTTMSLLPYGCFLNINSSVASKLKTLFIEQRT